MDEHLRKFCLKYRVKKINCSVIHQCALFIGYLKRNGISGAKMIKGFCVCANAACRHFWVDVNSRTVDVAREISIFHTPELRYLPTKLQIDMDDSMKRIDMEDPKIVEENERLFGIWEEDPKMFWKDGHRHITV